MTGASVCFVVTELLGTAPFGGIATATTHDALVLAKVGYDVEILYCGHDPGMTPEWERRYGDAGIRIRRLNRSTPVGPQMAADSYRVYEQLRVHPPAVIIFQDWGGLGFCSMQAKRSGEFRQSRLVHICHGPGDWLREANRRQEVDATDLAVAWMERRSAGLADTVVGPSRYLVDWMADRGWELPSDVHVIPYFTEGHVASLDRPLREVTEHPPLEELVFFGRLEERKGVRVFAEALNRIGPDVLAGVGVTFLGRAAPMSTDDVEAMLRPELLRSVDVRFETGLDQAGARWYLSHPGRVAVIPSLIDNSPNVIYECIEDRVPFLASDTGGNPELVHREDRGRVLFRPDAGALAEVLGRVLADGVVPAPARPSFDGPTSLAAWRKVLDPTVAADAATRERAGTDVGVTLVITHHDQGRYIEAAVASAVAQTHELLEIVVIDDGSTDPASLEVLDAIEAKDWGRPVRVVRQDNRYLGAARNAAARLATTDYVAFCDDDDVLVEDYIATLLDTAVRTGAGAVVNALLNREVDADGEFRTDRIDPVWVFLDGAIDVGTIWNTFGGAAMLVRRDVLFAVGGFHERRGLGHEDWDLLIRFALAGHEVLCVPRPLYHYRIRPGSMVRTTSQYENMAPVLESYQALLPGPLRGWPAFVRGQHLHLEQQREELDWLHGERARLSAELERRTRYLDVLRDEGAAVPASPPT